MSDDPDEIAVLQARITALRRERYAGDRAERRTKIEQSPRVQSIRKWYVAGQVSVAEIARAFNTSPGAIQALVRKYDWPRRSPPKVKGQRSRRGNEASTKPRFSGDSEQRERVAELTSPKSHPPEGA